MTADRPFFAGERGHFCSGCEFTPLRHLGCRTNGSMVLDPRDPKLIEMKAKAREDRETSLLGDSPLKIEVNPTSTT